MLEAKTVFILGAGASVEVNLPVGNQLLNQICALIDFRIDALGRITVDNGDNLVLSALRILLEEMGQPESFDQHIKAAQQIVKSAGTGLSIDNIVHSLEDEKVELVAKLGIVQAIHNAEKKSRHFQVEGESTFNINLIKKTWYIHLTKVICDNRQKSDIENVFENLSFVSFNYDRCIEHYLPSSIANYYGLPLEQVQDLFKRKVVIHRPYGIAGHLPWQVDDQRGCGFGGGHTSELAKSAKEIRTFTEAEEPDVRERIQTELYNAARIVFLGSAFHRQNLQILKLIGSKDLEILATAKGLSENERQVVKKELAQVFGIRLPEADRKITLVNQSCESMFSSFWRTISAPPNP